VDVPHTAAPGRAVQVDPTKPTLKVPGTERLKLNYEEMLANFGFKIQLAPLQPGRGPAGGAARGEAVQIASIRTRVESAPGFSA
jgi:hypothetical protein